MHRIAKKSGLPVMAVLTTCLAKTLISSRTVVSAHAKHLRKLTSRVIWKIDSKAVLSGNHIYRDLVK
jgi:hypothetical protein